MIFIVLLLLLLLLLHKIESFGFVIGPTLLREQRIWKQTTIPIPTKTTTTTPKINTQHKRKYNPPPLQQQYTTRTIGSQACRNSIVYRMWYDIVCVFVCLCVCVCAFQTNK
jgi:hypothetical protein